MNGMKAAQPDPPLCSRCAEPAVIYERHSHRHFCRSHLIADVQQRVLGTVIKRQMILDGARIAVAFSGGKDSTALLLLLCQLLSQWQDVRLVAITIDEGIAGYRQETIRSAKRLTQHLGVEHHIISFRERFGETLDSFLLGRESQACSICGILRRKALEKGAEEIGATRLATGHNLDDEAQSVLMNVLRGDLPRLVRDSGTDFSRQFIPRIKPLCELSEKEIAIYLMLLDRWTDLPECPYARFALRREVRSMLAQLEYRHPGTMLCLLESKKKIGRYLSGSAISEPLSQCRACGDPCSGDLCQVCQLRRFPER